MQTKKLVHLKHQYNLALARLNHRLVAIYESNVPSTLDFVLGSTSIDDVLEKADFVNLIGKEDKQIAFEVKRSKLRMQAQRTQTKKVRRKVQGDERAIAA